MAGQAARHRSRSQGQEIPWVNVWVALLISVVGTTVPGGILYALDQNVWWIALAGIASLFAGGAYVGSRSGEPEPLYGTLVATLYFGLVAGILFGGTLAEALPDPLPGLGIGDSTFYFVWPLLQLIAAVAGSVVGGHLTIRRDQNVSLVK